MKVYAVKKGHVKGIFMTWDECKAQVSGYKGAEYKSFNSMDDALAYMNGVDEVKQATEAKQEVRKDIPWTDDVPFNKDDCDYIVAIKQSNGNKATIQYASKEMAINLVKGL